MTCEGLPTKRRKPVDGPLRRMLHMLLPFLESSPVAVRVDTVRREVSSTQSSQTPFIMHYLFYSILCFSASSSLTRNLIADLVGPTNEGMAALC
jgi:hypothetical protein